MNKNEEDYNCGCYLCNGVTQHEQDMNYVCDICKEEQDDRMVEHILGDK